MCEELTAKLRVRAQPTQQKTKRNTFYWLTVVSFIEANDY